MSETNHELDKIHIKHVIDASHTLYKSLSPGHVRILKVLGLKVLPSQNVYVFEVVIVCGLDTVTLSDIATGKIECLALSYVWGSTPSTRRVLVNGVLKHVTENLYNALYNLVENSGPAGLLPISLWVDAVSINQDDIVEKNQQVAMMSDIYRSMTKTLVWLGTGSEQAGSGLAEFWKATSTDGSLSDVAIEAGQTFLKRCEWLYRSWIILAPVADVMCGQMIMSWEAFAERISRLSVGAFGLPGQGVSSVIETIETLKRERNNDSLAALVITSAGRHASDPRDRIYSLFGLWQDADQFDVDYAQSSRILYAKVCMIIFQEIGCLATFRLLEYSNDLRDSCSSNPGDMSINALTSWIPDWNRFEKDRDDGKFADIVSRFLETKRKSKEAEAIGLISASETSFVPENLGTAKIEDDGKAHRKTASFRQGGKAASKPQEWSFQSDDMSPEAKKARAKHMFLVDLHPSFTMNVSLKADRLVVNGALITQQLVWYRGEQSDDLTASHIDLQQPFPKCVASRSFENAQGPNDPTGTYFLNPDVYKPKLQTAKTIYFQSIAHLKSECQCNERPRTLPLRREHGRLVQHSASTREFFEKNSKSGGGTKGVCLIWQCVLFGSSQALRVQPQYDERSDEVICWLSGDGDHGLQSALQRTAEGYIRRPPPLDGQPANQNSHWDMAATSEQQRKRLNVSEWQTPADVLRLNWREEGSPMPSWIPVRLELSGESMFSRFEPSMLLALNPPIEPAEDVTVSANSEDWAAWDDRVLEHFRPTPQLFVQNNGSHQSLLVGEGRSRIYDGSGEPLSEEELKV